MLSLPAELVLHVASYLDPYSHLKLALTSRSLHEILINILVVHGTRYNDWKRIRVPCLNAHESNNLNILDPPTFLNKLLKESDFAQYIEILEVEADRSVFDYNEDISYPFLGNGNPIEPAAADVALWKVSLASNYLLRNPRDGLGDFSMSHYRDLFDITESEEEDWNNNREYDEYDTLYVRLFESGFPAALMAHALCLCPELRILRIEPFEEIYTMLPLVRSVSTMFKKQRQRLTISDLNEPMTQKPSSVPPFQHLTQVDLQYWAIDGGLELEWVICFLNFPSLKKLRGYMIKGNANDLFEEPSRASQVTELSIGCSNIHPSGWPWLCGEIANLKKFEYEYGGNIVSYPNWDPLSAIDVLRKYAGETLEDLRLWIAPESSDDEHLSESRPSLKRFARLETFCSDWKNIEPDIPEYAYKDFLLTDILPKSLRCLGLRLSDEDHRVAVTKLLENDLEDLPNLQEITVTGPKADNIRELALEKGLIWNPSLVILSDGMRGWKHSRCLDARA